jgi:small conductance mechanosensitive channel
MDKEVVKYGDLLIQYATEYGIKIIAALVIFIVGRIVSKWVSNILSKVMHRYKIDETLNKFVENGIYFVLMAVVVMASISELGVDTTSFMAILGAAGLAVGLALKDTLSNVGAAVVLLIFRPFKVGDFINAGGAEGTVDSIGLFTTTISPIDNRTIIVPNSAITGGNITNFSQKFMRRVDHVIGVGYNDDIKLVKETLYDVIKADERTLDDPAPLVAVAELGESSVNFTMRAWVKSADYWDAHFSLLESAKLALDAKGITIPYPQMDIHLEKKAETA